MQKGLDSISLSPGWGQVQGYYECGNETVNSYKARNGLISPVRIVSSRILPQRISLI